MTEFSINTDKIKNAAASIERQAKALQAAADNVDSVRRNLQIEGKSRAKVQSAIREISQEIKENSAAASQIGSTLQEIAVSYGMTEEGLRDRVSAVRSILDNIKPIKPVIPAAVIYAAPDPGPSGKANIADQVVSWLGKLVLPSWHVMLYAAPDFIKPQITKDIFEKTVISDWNVIKDKILWPVGTHEKAADKTPFAFVTRDPSEQYFQSAGKIAVTNATPMMIDKVPKIDGRPAISFNLMD